MKSEHKSNVVIGATILVLIIFISFQLVEHGWLRDYMIYLVGFLCCILVTRLGQMTMGIVTVYRVKNYDRRAAEWQEQTVEWATCMSAAERLAKECKGEVTEFVIPTDKKSLVEWLNKNVWR